MGEERVDVYSWGRKRQPGKKGKSSRVKKDARMREVEARESERASGRASASRRVDCRDCS